MIILNRVANGIIPVISILHAAPESRGCGCYNGGMIDILLFLLTLQAGKGAKKVIGENYFVISEIGGYSGVLSTWACFFLLFVLVGFLVETVPLLQG